MDVYNYYLDRKVIMNLTTFYLFIYLNAIMNACSAVRSPFFKGQIIEGLIFYLFLNEN